MAFRFDDTSDNEADPKGLPAMMVRSKDGDPDKEMDVGFVPSFYDPTRKPRRERRQSSIFDPPPPSSSQSASDTLDELDKMIGLKPAPSKVAAKTSSISGSGNTLVELKPSLPMSSKDPDSSYSSSQLPSLQSPKTSHAVGYSSHNMIPANSTGISKLLDVDASVAPQRSSSPTTLADDFDEDDIDIGFSSLGKTAAHTQGKTIAGSNTESAAVGVSTLQSPSRRSSIETSDEYKPIHRDGGKSSFGFDFSHLKGDITAAAPPSSPRIEIDKPTISKKQQQSQQQQKKKYSFDFSDDSDDGEYDMNWDASPNPTAALNASKPPGKSAVAMNSGEDSKRPSAAAAADIKTAFLASAGSAAVTMSSSQTVDPSSTLSSTAPHESASRPSKSSKVVDLTIDIPDSISALSSLPAASAAAPTAATAPTTAGPGAAVHLQQNDPLFSLDTPSRGRTSNINASASGSFKMMKAQALAYSGESTVPTTSSSWSMGAGSSASSAIGAGVGQTSLQSLPASTPTSSREAARINKLELDLEASKLSSEAVERKLRMEVDSLKAKLASAVSSSSSSFASPSASNAEARGSSLSMTPAEYSRQQQEDFEKWSKEKEVMRAEIVELKLRLSKASDELTIQKQRHSEEVKFLSTRHKIDLAAVVKQRDEEIQLVEKRHSDAVTALRAIHSDELAAIKERVRDVAVIERMTGQITNVSGSIRLIEEQLSAKYKGLEVAKEGQLEARERMLTEMEAQARARLDSSETETYRLKGLLMHMEQVVVNLRSQGMEEKERLRQEHQRLQAIQASLDADRQSTTKFSNDEMARIAKLQKAAEAEARKNAELHRARLEELNSAQSKLAADREEFAAFVASNTRASEQVAARLKDDEARLRRLREELSHEKIALEQDQAAAQRDLKEASKLREAVAAFRLEMKRERSALEEAAKDVQESADAIQAEAAELRQREDAILQREKALERGLEQMAVSASALSVRERQLVESLQLMELRQSSLDDFKDELQSKRHAVSAAEKELLTKHATFSRAKLAGVSSNFGFLSSSVSESLFPKPLQDEPTVTSKVRPAGDNTFKASWSFAREPEDSDSPRFSGDSFELDRHSHDQASLNRAVPKPAAAVAAPSSSSTGKATSSSDVLQQHTRVSPPPSSSTATIASPKDNWLKDFEFTLSRAGGARVMRLGAFTEGGTGSLDAASVMEREILAARVTLKKARESAAPRLMSSSASSRLSSYLPAAPAAASF